MSPHPRVAPSSSLSSSSWSVRLFGVIALLATAAASPDARAQGRPAASPIPGNFKTAPTLDPGQKKVIADTVGAHSGVIKNPASTVEQIRQARDAIYTDARPSGSEPISAAYALAIAKPVVEEFLPTIDNAAVPLPVQLNGAIVMSRVADQTHSEEFGPAALALLKSKQPALQLYGMKTARAILPELVAVNKHQQLLKQVIAHAERFAQDGAVMQDAYEAVAPGGRAVPAAVLGVLIEPLLHLMKIRAELYTAGVPDEPAADTVPALFLGQAGVWQGLNAKHQAEAMQALWSLVRSAAVRSNDPRASSYRDELRKTAVTGVGAIWVISRVANNAKFAEAADLAQKTASGVGVDLDKVTEPLGEAVRAVPLFKDVKDPVLRPMGSPVAPGGGVPVAPGPATGPAAAGGAAGGSAGSTASRVGGGM